MMVVSRPPSRCARYPETLSGFAIGALMERNAKATQILSKPGIPVAAFDRRPHALSGGQCQRVALAQALAAEPKLLIRDKPPSSLDLTTQVTTIRLLRRVHTETGLAMLIVSHNLAHLRQLADRIVVLNRGRIVECIANHSFVRCAKHALSRAYAQTLKG
ncbi:MAG: ATP-binding cassette domain-containing protein [Pseudomonadota bacterium]